MNVSQMSFAAGILILFVVALRAVAFYRLPKTTFLALWGIALARLLVPFSIPAKFSVHNLPGRLGLGIALRIEAVDGSKTAVLFHRGAGKMMEAVSGPLPIKFLYLLWVTGSVVLALVFLISFLQSNRRIRTALPFNNDLTKKWLDESGITRPVRILVSDQISTPLTFGMIKPKIILPKMMNFSHEGLLEYVLTHELIHIKRLDVLWKLLLIVAACLHWFNPLVWVLVFLMNRDLEITCDQQVLKIYGAEARSNYALSLIKMAEGKAQLAPLASAFSKNATKERIVSIMRFRKTPVLAVVLALICIAGATLIFAENATPRVFMVKRMLHLNNSELSFGSVEIEKFTAQGAEGKVVVYSKEKGKIEVKVYQRRTEKDIFDQKIKIKMKPDQLPRSLFKTDGEGFTYRKI